MQRVALPQSVNRVQRRHATEAAEVLAQAFLEESATNYFFPPEEGNKLEKLRALFGWAVEYRLRADLPLLGVWGVEDVLAGVATLRVPTVRTSVEADDLWPHVLAVIGADASARIDAYDELQNRHLPDVPHHYLVAIGVLPHYQGRGLGGRLIQAAIALAEADPSSKGIGLDTGSEQSQALYEHFGFRLTATGQLGEKTARFMFRPNGAGLG